MSNDVYVESLNYRLPSTLKFKDECVPGTVCFSIYEHDSSFVAVVLLNFTANSMLFYEDVLFNSNGITR